MILGTQIKVRSLNNLNSSSIRVIVKCVGDKIHLIELYLFVRVK